jgi:hypothetical protein
MFARRSPVASSLLTAPTGHGFAGSGFSRQPQPLGTRAQQRRACPIRRAREREATRTQPASSFPMEVQTMKLSDGWRGRNGSTVAAHDTCHGTAILEQLLSRSRSSIVSPVDDDGLAVDTPWPDSYIGELTGLWCPDVGLGKTHAVVSMPLANRGGGGSPASAVVCDAVWSCVGGSVPAPPPLPPTAAARRAQEGRPCRPRRGRQRSTQ